MANRFRETVRTFRAVNKLHGFRARVVAPTQTPPAAIPFVSGTAAGGGGGNWIANGQNGGNWIVNGQNGWTTITTVSSGDVQVFGPPVAKAAEPVRAVLEIYDAIGSDFFGDGITAKTIAAAMKQMEAAKATVLDIYINSPGGDVFEATAIYNILDRFPGPKNVFVDGLAASAASYIAMVGTTITTASNAMWMVHDPWGVAIGNASELRDQAELLDKVAGTLVGTYARRTKLSDAEIRSIMADETWMTAEEALAKGFTDTILSAEEEPDENDPMEPMEPPEPEQKKAAARAVALLNKYEKTPEKIRPDYRARIASMEARTSPRGRTEAPAAPAKK